MTGASPAGFLTPRASVENCLFRVLYPFLKIRIFVFLFLSYESSSCTLATIPCQINDLPIFPALRGFLVVFFRMSSEAQSFRESLIQHFCCLCFCYLKKHCQILGHEDLSLCSLLREEIVFCCILVFNLVWVNFCIWHKEVVQILFFFSPYSSSIICPEGNFFPIEYFWHPWPKSTDHR